jgi:SAM-dependent methyltransferase
VTTPERVDNPFSADLVGALYADGRPFHHERSLEQIRAIVGDAPLGRALDVACGTGMSTIALTRHAPAVVGVDVSPAMLGSAPATSGVSFLLGNAESLPFPADQFDAVTVCSGVHWFDQPRFFADAARVLRPGGWLALYDHYFVGEMVGVPEFTAWAQMAFERFPLPPRNHQVGDPRAETPAGWEQVGATTFVDDIEMTADTFAAYQLSISNFVAAAERGTPRDGLRAWLLETTGPLFAGAATRTVRFLGTVLCLRPQQSA